jgi:hypothetical protein
MSNDLTEPMGSDKYDTTPGVTAILERINQVHADLVGRIDQVSTDLVEYINGVSTEMRESDSAILDLIGEVRTELVERINQNHSTVLTRLNDIEGQVRLTNAKLDVNREDLFNTKVQVHEVRSRVEELERKSS